MAKRKKAIDAASAAELRAQMVEVMKELAFRSRAAEGLMMRVANAGGLVEVIQEIKRRRLYSKKMGLQHDGHIAPAPKKRTSKKRRKGATSEDHDADDSKQTDTA